jgi:hypothetical protein
MNDSLNRIRKNVALLTRNIPASLTNATFGSTTPNRLGNKLFFINTTPVVKTLKYSDIRLDFPTSSVDSVIIVGGDLIIDADMLNGGSLPKGVIVLKNDQ